MRNIPITVTINQILNTGFFSDKLQIAKVISRYKKDNETYFANY